MNSKYLVYALVDPFTDEARYVGKSCSGLKRPRDHSKPSELKYDTHKVHWIKSLINQGTKPKIHILKYYDNATELDEAEQHWIQHYKHLGANLTNSDNGGTGSLGRKTKTSSKQKMSEKRTQHYNKIKEQNNGVVPARKKLHIYDRGLELKECKICTAWLELDCFWKNKTMWDGLQYKCKSCDTKQRRNYKKYERKLTDDELKQHKQERVKQMNSTLTKEDRKKYASQPIACINLETQEIKRYSSAKEAIIDGFHATRISTAIKKEIPYNDHFFVKDGTDADIHLKLACDVISLHNKVMDALALQLDISTEK